MLITVGGSGFELVGKRCGPLVARKKKLMAFIAANGILILVPAALYLSVKAQAGAFDTRWYSVQAVELIAGGVNIVMLSLSMRDGLRLTGARRSST